jgi:hypothetical protein
VNKSINRGLYDAKFAGKNSGIYFFRVKLTKIEFTRQVKYRKIMTGKKHDDKGFNLNRTRAAIINASMVCLVTIVKDTLT